MARGKLPAQTPQVPTEVFLPFDLLYTYVSKLGEDVGVLEGVGVSQESPIVSNAVLALQTKLSVPVLPGRNIKFSAVICTSGNMKFRVVGPASPARLMFKQDKLETGGALATTLESAYSAEDIVFTNPGMLILKGILKNGTAADRFGLQAAQNTSSATASMIYPRSWIQYSYVD